MKRESLLQIRMSIEERNELKAFARSKGQTEAAMARRAIKDAIEMDRTQKGLIQKDQAGGR